MQRVTSLLPSWDKTKTGSKKGFDKVWGWADKLGAPVNRLTNKIGSEAFWPTTLDKESDKAARILRSFCKDGFYTDEEIPGVDGPASNTKQRVLKKIPQSVIQNAVGLAIFTTMRSGLWISGAGGSGVLIARKEDGTWSPPSGILLHTAGVGFLVGVDIYDCVVVINNRKALEGFTKLRATLGGEISAVAGPVGIGGVLEHDGRYKQLNKPVFTYMKSRGFYAGVQVDGTVIIERKDENERFYNQKIGVGDILAGKVRYPPYEIKMLMETIKAAEGRTDVDRRLMEELEDQPAPGDVGIEPPAYSTTEPLFGIPEADDPDPFGVLALERAGMEIRQAGSGTRPASSQFEFRPSPSSPIYPQFNRNSIDMVGSLRKRGSTLSTTTRNSVDQSTQTEVGTQTDPPPAEIEEKDVKAVSTRSSMRSHRTHSSVTQIIREEPLVQETVVPEPEDIDYTKVDLGPINFLSRSTSREFDGSGTTANSTHSDHSHDQDKISVSDISTHSDYEHDIVAKSDAGTDVIDLNSDDEADLEEEPVIFEAAAAQSVKSTAMRIPQVNLVQARGNIVTIGKRIPPALPPRSPMRSSRTASMIDASSDASPLSGSPLSSPVTDGFEEADVSGVKRESYVSAGNRASYTSLGGNASEKCGSPLKEEVKEEPVVMAALEEKVEDEKLDTNTSDITAILETVHKPAEKDTEYDSETFHSLPATPLPEVQLKESLST